MFFLISIPREVERRYVRDSGRDCILERSNDINRCSDREGCNVWEIPDQIWKAMKVIPFYASQNLKDQDLKIMK